MKNVIVLVSALALAAGCSKSRTENKAESAATVTDPAKTEPARTEPAKAGTPIDPTVMAPPCCCLGGQYGDFLAVGVDGCRKVGGYCEPTWGEKCKKLQEKAEADAAALAEKAASERNAADAQCKSGDRRDCDGDGVRSDVDKDDLNPKVK